MAKQAAQPQVIVQQQTTGNDVDVIEQIQKLKGLQESGIITEEEFNQKKAVLLEKL